MKLLKKESLSSTEEMERIIHALRTTSDDQATAILAKLRIGARLDQILKDIPPSVFSTAMSKRPSILAHDSLGTSGSSDSHLPGTSSLHESDSRRTSSPTRGRPSFAFLAQSSLTRSERTAVPSDGEKSPFLALLFDREDFLEAISEDEDENYNTVNEHGFIDPRLLGNSSSTTQNASSSAAIDGPSRPSRESSRANTVRIHGLIPLSNRQPIVNTLRLHPNLSLVNLFGNMPFSSSVRANNYPRDIQDTQVNNLFVPTWAMMTVNTRPDPGSLKTAFYGLHQEVAIMMGNGVPIEAIIETHPNIAALFDEAEYNKSGVLSRWAAGIVHSIRHKGDDFTAFASMYLTWYLARWMISPSPETYEAMPVWLRPTPNQLFMPHTNILDFIIWPAFREYVVEFPEMHEHMEYMLDMSNTIRCDWFFATEEAFFKVDETRMFDLCMLAKASMRDLSCWSVGPSFRQYVANADSYVRIRTEAF
ncbi:hypothetical protein DE146DRAFT_283260 [Phaeosphaeria sp. MPI-PUGE-AT-0046c]|nr:hypothetical protein DE146DRAFT_283260 [Phaeosphaeria sp. MPI-PUGE-AT-0046c]